MRTQQPFSSPHRCTVCSVQYWRYAHCTFAQRRAERWLPKPGSPASRYTFCCPSTLRIAWYASMMLRYLRCDAMQYDTMYCMPLYMQFLQYLMSSPRAPQLKSSSRGGRHSNVSRARVRLVLRAPGRQGDKRPCRPWEYEYSVGGPVGGLCVYK